MAEEAQMNNTQFYDSLWRYYANENAFIKSSFTSIYDKDTTDNVARHDVKMVHTFITVAWGFVNWYEPGYWGYNTLPLFDYPVCDFAFSCFLEDLDIASRASRVGDGGKITSAAVNAEARAILYKKVEQIRGEMKHEATA
jgi:hypothetical protein